MSLFELIGPILQAAIRSGTPLLLAATGELFAERAGVLNLGIEGMMLVGALAGFLSSYLISNIAVALLAAIVFGGLVAFIHAYLTVTLRSDQVVSGLAITLLGVGLTSFLDEASSARWHAASKYIACPACPTSRSSAECSFSRTPWCMRLT